MKKRIVTLLLLSTFSFHAKAQTEVNLSMGAGYANNIWYNLDNDASSSSSATNWDIALAATSSPSNALTASILFNTKNGKIYAVPSTTPAGFNTVDTTGLNDSWTPLYNDPTSWSTGALNQPSTGGLDYGWASYNISTHNLEANRVFVIKYPEVSPGVLGVAYKFYISLNSVAGVYTLTYDQLDNSDLESENIDIATYSTKNFVYYSLASKTILDREPIASDWDFILTQYYDEYGSPSSMQNVGGVLHNQGIEVAQATGVDPDSYEDYNAETFSADINTIGYDWKSLNYSTFQYETETDWVYFVKRKNNDIWKVVFTAFVGSSNGNVSFTKEKLYSATTSILSSNSTSKNTLVVYPNPSTGGSTTVLYDCKESSASTLEIYDLAGVQLQKWEVNANTGLNAYTINTSGLNAGLYVVSIRSNENLFQQKLIVK